MSYTVIPLKVRKFIGFSDVKYIKIKKKIYPQRFVGNLCQDEIVDLYLGLKFHIYNVYFRTAYENVYEITEMM